MAENYPLEQDVTYCKPKDVARVLSKPSNYFSLTNAPITETDVQEMIYESEEQVDSDTQTAFRVRRVVDETHDVDPNEYFRYGVGLRIKLNYKYIKQLDNSLGDKLEVWNGNAYVDYVTQRQEGRGNDYWINYVTGELFIRDRVMPFREQAIRITYRYGQDNVPKNIQQATALKTAILILINEDRSFTLSETGETRNMNYDQRVSAFEKRYNQAIKSKTDIFVC